MKRYVFCARRLNFQGTCFFYSSIFLVEENIVLFEGTSPPFCNNLELFPFQMAVSWLITGGDPNHKSLDDTPSGVALPNSTGGTEICTAEPTALPKAILGKVSPGTKNVGT